MSKALMLAAGLLLAGDAAAITIGDPASGKSCLVLSCPGRISRYQQIYSAAEFGGPIPIAEIRFLRTPPLEDDDIFPGLVTGSFEFYLTTSDRSVSGLDPNDLDSNVGADRALFAALHLEGGPPPPILIVSGGPFDYDPSAGNLLLDIVVLETSGRGEDVDPAGFDAHNGAGVGIVSQVFSPARIEAGTDGWGFVNEFVAVPEPGSLALLGAALMPLLALRRRPS